jgi:hypothetical protein
MGRESATKKVKVGVFLQTYKTEIEPLNPPSFWKWYTLIFMFFFV